MRERAQRCPQPVRVARSPASQLTADGIQYCRRMVDKRIGLWKIAYPPPVASGCEQSSRLKRTQVHAGLVLGDARLHSNFSDRQSRRFQNNRQTRQPPHVHQRPTCPPYSRMVNGQFTSHEMWIKYHPHTAASNAISSCHIQLRAGRFRSRSKRRRPPVAALYGDDSHSSAAGNRG